VGDSLRYESRAMTAWISVLIAIAAFLFSLWTWWARHKSDQKRLARERLDRVSVSLARLSGMANKAAQGSPDATNELPAAQMDLAIAISAAGVELPATLAAANAAGALKVQAAANSAFIEVPDAVARLAA
jgi:hypothetical protein